MSTAAPGPRVAYNPIMEKDKQRPEPSKSLLRTDLSTQKTRGARAVIVAAFLSLVASIVLFFGGNENESISSACGSLRSSGLVPCSHLPGVTDGVRRDVPLRIVVTAIVFLACFLIIFGSITEKQEREKLEAQQAADRASGNEFVRS